MNSHPRRIIRYLVPVLVAAAVAVPATAAHAATTVRTANHRLRMRSTSADPKLAVSGQGAARWPFMATPGGRW